MIKASNGDVEVGGNGLRIMMDYSLLTTTILEVMTEEIEDDPELTDGVVKMLTIAFKMGMDRFHERREHAGEDKSETAQA